MLVLLNVSQEEVPLVKHYISVAKCEPLYLKNNIYKELFIKIWKDLFGAFIFQNLKPSHIFQQTIFSACL